MVSCALSNRFWYVVYLRNFVSFVAFLTLCQPKKAPIFESIKLNPSPLEYNVAKFEAVVKIAKVLTFFHTADKSFLLTSIHFCKTFNPFFTAFEGKLGANSVN